MSLAIATSTAPAQWWDEDDETLATAIYILDEQRKAAEKRHG